MQVIKYNAMFEWYISHIMKFDIINLYLFALADHVILIQFRAMLDVQQTYSCIINACNKDMQLRAHLCT